MHAAWNRLNAEFLTSTYDAIIIHDPQPAALREFAPNAAHKWIWRSHIDTSAPEPETWRRLSALVNGFDASAFSLPEYAGPGLSGMPIAIMPPAIDPFTPKNTEMPFHDAMHVVARFGIDPTRPFISQVSRFDRGRTPSA